MSSLRKMLSLLDVFTREHPVLSADEIAARAHLSRTTCYRYLRELTQAGLLANNGRLYGLGHRIVRLDHQIRSCDPLIRLARPRMLELVRRTGGSVLLSCLDADEQILNLHVEAHAHMPPLQFGRGQVLPPFRSATSKVMLAALARHRLQKLYERHAADPGLHAMGADWRAFQRFLHEIRARQYVVSRGEMPAGLVGMAVAIGGEPRSQVAALTLLLEPERYELLDEQRIGAMLAGHAAALGEELAAAQQEGLSADGHPACRAP